ncbi:unnamed protein product [Penicillium salamii]|uniref:HNH nuclease domain-containing protein n=1 Tax=Penicillium salamii TaxID=1612424 RepID=A0A9W4K3N1_9EURO|nr:unnamed protein product [Penicillium salamii]
MIALNTHAHTYWDCARIAFKPISVNPERTEMLLSFHWLPFPDDIGTVSTNQPSIITTNPYQGGFLSEPSEHRHCLFHTVDREVLRSGYMFTVKPTDPTELPLPSLELLQLRWHLSRIAAMQGRDEDEDDDGDDHTDDDSDDDL